MQGLIHLYCGDGKGKTTAALGLSLRVAGYGKRVLVVQFLKGSPSGELVSLQQIPLIQILRQEEALGFSFGMNAEEKAHASKVQQALLVQACALVSGGEYALLVLDEVFAACSAGMLSEEEILVFLHKKPAELEVVLTGRNPPQSLLDLADYVSEIHKIKHPFDRGIAAREGIEQ